MNGSSGRLSVGPEPPPIQREGVGNLSPRETQVLSLAAAGLMDKQIGPHLGVSANTLRTYWTRIRSKMGEASRSALAVAYVESLEKPEPSPDWELDLETGAVRKLSIRPLIEGPVGMELSLDQALARVHPEDRPQLRTALDGVKTASDSSFMVSIRVVMPDGNIRKTGLFIQVLRDASGTPVKAIGWRTQPFGVPDESEHFLAHSGWAYDPKTGLILAADATNEWHGLRPGIPHPREAYHRAFFEEDCAKAVALTERVASGELETATYTMRTRQSGGSEEFVMTLHAVRGSHGEVVEVVGFTNRIQVHASGKSSSAPKVRVGFWAKNLRSNAFIVPDEEFCRIYRVEKDSPKFDQEIRSRYKPEDADAAYDFISEAVSQGKTRGFREFTLRFEDGSEEPIRLEFFVESDELGPIRVNGTVLAFT
ncbi:MAG TPA: LuxR C-terminal-related transcriptional regulator [Fimbriimonas sp.]|nr:LuxR C-terminal-related transcriptional regulator [Fimbriimonas sp.]